jgi:hypothetical protein
VLGRKWLAENPSAFTPTLPKKEESSMVTSFESSTNAVRVSLAQS